VFKNLSKSTQTSTLLLESTKKRNIELIEENKREYKESKERDPIIVFCLRSIGALYQ
jgi:hypothetical protein